jgi:tetratricopeptide (TPR) repeat protein
MMATDPNKVRPARPPKVPPPPAPILEVEFLKQVEDSLGFALWKALRNVHTWAEAKPGERKRYFRPQTDEARELWAYARHAAPELDSAIATFALIVQAPEAIDREQIGAACDAVHTWADARGMTLTAFFFAEAAAYVLADLPSRANQAARAARRNLKRERAAMWYMRAYRLAVRHQDKKERRKELIWALLGYGSMMRDAGNYDEARRFIERAARRAVGLRRPKEAGMAYHELFVIAAEREQYTLAAKYARDALERYPIRHVSLPHFAHDVAFMLYIRQQQFSAALTILINVLPHMQLSRDRALVLSSLAWTTGGAGLRERYRGAETATLTEMAEHREYAPAIFIHLAQGARLLGEWDRALKYAEAARESAIQNEDEVLGREAAGLVEAVNRREPPAAEAKPNDELESFARMLVARLGRWRPRAAGGPGPG